MRPSPLFSTIQTGEAVYDVDHATYKGIGLKLCAYMAVAICVALLTAFGLPAMLNGNPVGLYVALSISSVVGFISVMIGRLNDRAAKYAGMIYCVCEGLFLGALSAVLEMILPGAAMMAILSTLVIFSVMAVLFFTGVIRVGSFFRRFMMGLSFSLLAIMLFGTIFGLIFPSLFANIGVLIGMELFLLLYGVFTLLLNFDEAKMVVELGATKQAEWSVALGMMVTLVYIYVEIVRVIMLFVASNQE